MDAAKNLPYKGGNTLTGRERPQNHPMMLSANQDPAGDSSHEVKHKHEARAEDLGADFKDEKQKQSCLNHRSLLLYASRWSDQLFLSGLALTFILENSFRPESGSRPGVPKIGILLTDGKSQDDVTLPAQSLRDAGVEVFAIGTHSPSRPDRRLLTGHQHRGWYQSFSSANNGSTLQV